RTRSRTAGSTAGRTQAVAHAVFAPVGDVVEVPEERIDALSAISGSGPVYVFLLIEELTRTAEAKGFSPDEAVRVSSSMRRKT
uniref:pyrroline-5-carboxylate reductase family protein n=1 Tax=Clavibacter michiganensis TaxID=28447 RepID=UPI00293178D2